MTPLDFAGHYAYAFVAAGMFLLTRKQKVGWLLRFAGELGWIVIGLLMGMTSIWMWGIVFLAIDVRGYYLWWKWEGKHADKD